MAACRTQVSLHEAINWWSATAECGFVVLFILSKDRLHPAVADHQRSVVHEYKDTLVVHAGTPAAH